MPDIGCRLDHTTARSYGASQTQRLCRVPLPVILTVPSSPILVVGSPSAVSATPKDFRLRTYFHIHSPIIVCEMASTTLICGTGLQTEAAPVAEVLRDRGEDASIDGW